jgi:predicted P-loop ATPase
MANSITALKDKSLPGIVNNPTLWISEGSSRYSTQWKNRQIKWSELLKRLQDPTRTQETQAEYFKMKKSDQDNIKDVGGFVGGTLTDGHRKTDTVKARTILSFDLDQAPVDFVPTMQLETDYAWAVYSTHKHTPDKPRFRLLVPLSRPVTPEEYEATARWMAQEIGLEYMDSTTFQASRLMYWPSASRDAEYVFEYSDDRVLDPDEILKKYPDWTDISYWPVCPDEVRVNKKRTDRQQDPLKKEGPVGTFCRTYDVPAAISAFLSETYAPVEGKTDRYTYLQGTTHGGLVIYDGGSFCYSNHSTDPAHGMDLNAFDLVRIHKYGAEDEDAKEGTPTTRLPSYRAMLDLIRKDKNCIRTYDADKRAQAAGVFSDEGDEETGHEWRLDLTRNKKGEVEATVDNLLMILRRDEQLQGIRYNELLRDVCATSSLPWQTDRVGEWHETDDSNLYIYLAVNYMAFKRQDIHDALSTVAHERPYHPVREYLKSLPEWDGVNRADRILIDYLGADDSEYTREVTKRWLLAAVKRAMVPGCKFDYLPVLSGPGGIGKSMLVNKLGGAWFSDSLSFEDMRDKTAAEKIQGTWINEISELKGMRKMEVESIKSFVSRQEDIYRPAYGRWTEHRARGCVFIGTSNADDYLKDITGNRRFWPVECSKDGKLKSWEITDEIRDQIWAEAWYYYDILGDTDLRLPRSLEQVATDKQVQALEADERMGMVGKYLERRLPENWRTMSLEDRRFWLDNDETEGTVERTQVSIMEIWAECFRKRPEDKKRSDSDDIVRILQQLGWERCGRTRVLELPIYGKQRMYRRQVADQAGR